MQLASWGLYHHSSAGSEEQIHFSQQSPEMLKMASESHALLLLFYFHKGENDNYNPDFVRRNTHSNTDSNTQTNVNFGPITTAIIQYIRGTSESHVYYNLTIYVLHTN